MVKVLHGSMACKTFVIPLPGEPVPLHNGRLGVGRQKLFTYV